MIHANFFMSGLVGLRLKEVFGIPLAMTFHALGLVRREHQGADDGFPPLRTEIPTFERIGLALLVNRKIHGRTLLRTILFAPYVLSEAVTGVAWVLILQPDGPADTLLRSIGLGDEIQLWLANPDIVLYTLFVVITWKYIGFAIILFLAGLQGIPREVVEAAQIDGATSWRVLRHITLPLLGPTIRTWIFLSIIGVRQLFDLIWIMTGGGPANASDTMATYIIERGFERSQFGYGSAVAVILFIISLTFALFYQRLVLRRDTQGATSRAAG